MAGIAGTEARDGRPRAEAATAERDGPRFEWTLRGTLAGIVVVAAAAVCIALGFWQLDRHQQRQDRNGTIAAAALEPVLVLDAAAIAAIAREPEAYAYRRVRAEGATPAASEFLLRGRSHMGQPGVHLLAPLHLAATPAVMLVNRGWLPAPDAVTVDPRPYAEPEARVVEGIVLPLPDAGGAGRPMEIDLGDYRVFSIGRMDGAAVEARFAAPALPFYVQQLPEDGRQGLPVRLDIPALEPGPHLAYAVQWFGFAAVFLVGFAVVVARRGTDARGDAAPA